MAAIFFGAGALLALDPVKTVVFSLGGLFLLFTGIGMLRSIRSAEMSSQAGVRGPFAAGMLLSILNPYFLVWWATVGATLIAKSVGFGFIGFMLFSMAHWTCDFICFIFSPPPPSRAAMCSASRSSGWCSRCVEPSSSFLAGNSSSTPRECS